MFDLLVRKESKIAVVGLGYVGLPVALEMSRKYRVTGFDINAKRIEMMRLGIDPSNELEAEDFNGCDIHFTATIEDLREASFYIVAVPTPIDKHKNPDLRPLLSACKTVGSVLSKGDIVVFESTVYPGCTEEDCAPVLEEYSGLKFGRDFQLGYSPERINPGDKEHTFTKIIKVVSASDQPTLDVVSKVYESVVLAGVYRASSIKVAEAAKIIENTQRDLNIALMNELSLIFKKMDINTYEVLEAAGTKWNFLKFFPGLVGGHCIGVDPYYLTYKSDALGYHSRVINAGRIVNDSMGAQIAREVVQYLISKDKSLKQTRVLVMGVTFKENVSDIRNSKVPDVIHELRSFMVNVDAVDPNADTEEFHEEYGIQLKNVADGKYDALILAVSHEEYLNLHEDFLGEILVEDAVVYDVKGILKNRQLTFAYRSL
ncbi:MAG: nucleotide sugar dehydrogenase [Cyclobacteriaceae bacterium]|nr:nucleotide sugar dehydrogenase [Cyclobacteriaceae bacterium]